MGYIELTELQDKMCWSHSSTNSELKSELWQEWANSLRTLYLPSFHYDDE